MGDYLKMHLIAYISGERSTENSVLSRFPRGIRYFVLTSCLVKLR